MSAAPGASRADKSAAPPSDAMSVMASGEEKEKEEEEEEEEEEACRTVAVLLRPLDADE